MPHLPSLGASIALFDGGRVLLVRRGRAPLVGLWSLPGGRVRFGERLEAAARRELAEETGAVAGPLVQVTALDVIVPESDSHFVVVVHAGRRAGGTLQAGDDAAALGWFEPSEIERLATTPGLADIVAHAAALLPRDAA